jgi:hypothetical protein
MDAQHRPMPNNPDRDSQAPRYQTFRGTAFPFFETGTEGLVWAMQPPESKGYDDLIFLQKGDFVTILSPTGEKLFEGEIKPNFEGGAARQACWIQAGWDPKAWGQLFVTEQNTAVVLRPNMSRPKDS